jgi:hypothetical protein
MEAKKFRSFVSYERTPSIVITDLLGKTVLVILSLALITTLGTGQISRADPLHYDRTVYPSSYSVGFSDGQANPGASCPGGHSKEFCSGWDAGPADGSNSSNNNPTTGSSGSSSYEAADGGSNTGTDWMGIRTTLQPALYSSCDTLVNSGTLTAEGQRALGCIKNGAMLAGSAGLLGVSLPFIGKGLSLLAAPTGMRMYSKDGRNKQCCKFYGWYRSIINLLP